MAAKSRSCGKATSSPRSRSKYNGERSALAVSKGDEVIYGRYSGNDVEVDGKEVKIMREGDILAKVVK